MLKFSHVSFVKFVPFGIFAYPIYILVFAFLKYVISFIFDVPPKIFIIARYCKTGLPTSLSKLEMLAALTLLVVRYLMVILSIIYLKKSNSMVFKNRTFRLVFSFALIEGLGLLAFFYDTSAVTRVFRFFASTLYIYSASELTSNTILFAIINICLLIFGAILLGQSVGIKIRLVKPMILSILSISLLAVVNVVYQSLIR